MGLRPGGIGFFGWLLSITQRDDHRRSQGMVARGIGGQDMTADQRVGLPPTLVRLLGVLVDVLGGQFGEGAGAALGLLLRRRIAAPCHLQHRLSRERAGIGETDGVGVAESIPAWPTVAAVDAVPRSGAGRLHPQHQAGLLRIPDQVRGGVGTLALDDQLG
jgi:hypothetical protein